MAKWRRAIPFSRKSWRLRRIGRRALAMAALAMLAGGFMLADRAGLFGLAKQGDAERYDNVTCRVARVIDGDTLDVEITDAGHASTRIRLWGVDTPETVDPRKPKQPYGKEASALTRKLAEHSTVRLELEPGARPRDPYGRLLAWVYLPDGRLLNRVLVEEGAGYADPRFDHHLKAEFRKLQDQAMRASLGLWKNLTPENLPYYYKDLKLPAHR
jgi:micrococcal nuclease